MRTLMMILAVLLLVPSVQAEPGLKKRVLKCTTHESTLVLDPNKFTRATDSGSSLEDAMRLSLGCIIPQGAEFVSTMQGRLPDGITLHSVISSSGCAGAAFDGGGLDTFKCW